MGRAENEHGWEADLTMFTTDATNLPRLMACNGSRLLTPAVARTDDDTTMRDEGIAAHWLASVAFNGEFTVEELIDRKAPNGVYITADMAEHVEWYLNTISNHRGTMEVETTFGNDLWRVYARADHIRYMGLSGGDTLHIDDFKYGWRIVEPSNNWTLIAHAIGYCIINQIQPSRIVFTILQPRPHHSDGKAREWVISYDELLQLHAQINATLTNPSDELRTGSHCAKCPALATCPAARKSALNAIDVAEQAFNEEMSNGELSYELDLLNAAANAIEHRKSALEELALFRVKAGGVVDNYSMEIGLGNRRWKDGLTVELLHALTGKDLAAKAKAITPAQAEKIVPKEIIATMVERPSTGMKLVRANASKKATKIFGER